jgi:hypothetical protein
MRNRAIAGRWPSEQLGLGLGRVDQIQHSVVINHVQRVRRRHPDAGPAEIIMALEKQYLATVTASGAAVGAAAAAPSVGFGVALGLTTAESVTFLEATALFMLAVAEVHGVRMDDVEQRRILLSAILSGTSGTGLAQSGKKACRWLVGRYRTRHSILALAKLLPFGIGMVIGAMSNRAAGRRVIASCRHAFDAASRPVEPEAPDPDPLILRAAPVPTAPVPVSEAPMVQPNGTPPGAVTGKYRPLFDYLVTLDDDHTEMGFVEIGHMVTGGLPKLALTNRGWWSNSTGSGRGQANAWIAAGFQVAEVDLGTTTVHFARRNGTETGVATGEGPRGTDRAGRRRPRPSLRH